MTRASRLLLIAFLLGPAVARVAQAEDRRSIPLQVWDGCKDAFGVFTSWLRPPSWNTAVFRPLLFHDVPTSLVALPKAERKEYLPDAITGYELWFVRDSFRSDEDYYRFIALTRKLGFPRNELQQFILTNGHHRAVEMILRQVQAQGTGPETKAELLRLSEADDERSYGGAKLPVLKFTGVSHVDIYRGTTVSEAELARFFAMQWTDYTETRDPKLSTATLSPWGQGKYFSIDKRVALESAISGHDERLDGQSYYCLLVEAKVPKGVLKKTSGMARWSPYEFQYDPDRIEPKEITAFTLLFAGGKSVRIPGALLLANDRTAVRALLKGAGMKDAEIAKLTDAMVRQ